ncbi:hypothetical protein BG004_004634 [Podila humilis]|nr:hypothetical protein BG004_004634 [Podila humilis]
MDAYSSQDDTLSSSISSTNTQQEQQQRSQEDKVEEGEDTLLEFRLFSTQDTPTKISLAQQKPTEQVMKMLEATHRLRRELDEDPSSERIQQIHEAAIDAMTILEQAQIPWARTFFEHKIIRVAYQQQQKQQLNLKARTQKTKPSRAKRVWAKKIATGEITFAEKQASARKIKVSESYGRKPYLERKGLGRNTIDPGTTSFQNRGGGRGRGGRGGGGTGRGGRGGGASRGGGGIKGRGGGRSVGANQERNKATSSSSSSSTSASIATTTTAVAGSPSSQDVNSTTNKRDASTQGHILATAAAQTPVKVTRESATTTTTTTTTKSSTLKGATTLPKKPKAKKDNKPMSKIDNIMAMLMSK